MKKISRALAVFACGLVIGFVIPRRLELKFPIPPKPVTPITDKAFCREIVGSWIDAGIPNASVTEKKYIKGTISKGAETISISIEGNQMHLLTQTSFGLGSTKDESPAQIVTNSPDIVIAITTYGRENKPIYDVFSLNKRTGIGLWSKVYTAETLSENPLAENGLFDCEPR